MDLGKILFGEDLSKNAETARDSAKAAREDAARAHFVEGVTPEERLAIINSADEYANQAADEYASALRKQQNNPFGNGIAGMFLNPVAQVTDAALDATGANAYLKNAIGQDLTEGERQMIENTTKDPGTILNQLFNPVAKLATGVENLKNRYDKENPYLSDLGGIQNTWNGDRKQNNALSDLGALINTASTVAGGAGLGSALSLGKKMALEGALGGAQQLGYGLEERGNFGDDTGNVLSDIGTGAAFGAAFPLVGSVAGKIGQRGENYLANQALTSGLANTAEDAANIAKNTGKLTKARAAFSSLPKWGKVGLVGGTAAGGVALNNLMNSGNNNQTGYDDNAIYGSDNYGTTQGYNYGTYGY